MYPDVELKALDSIEIEKPLVEVTDADVDTMLKTLRKQQATWKESDRATELEDRVTIDFTGSIDGEEFEGGKASDFVLVIGQGRMIPGFKKVWLVTRPVKNSPSMLTFRKTATQKICRVKRLNSLLF